MTSSLFSRRTAVLAASVLGSLTALLLSHSTHAQTPAPLAVSVVEYYNKSIAAYFLTGRASEQAALDTVADFQRTGVTFAAIGAAGAMAPLSAVCRYKIAVTGSAFTSHFYGLPADCAAISAANLTNFTNEGLDFAVERPTNGVCPASSPVPIYRALRALTPVDVPNHRYSVSAAAYQEMLTRGWNGEGVVFCARAATAETARPALAASSSFRNVCALPRSGIDPQTGAAYTDRTGSDSDEKKWLRSWIDETYLWYREVPVSLNADLFATPIDYFNALKTPALTLSGTAKDKFHFTRNTVAYNTVSSGSASIGYGVAWRSYSTAPPRKWVAMIVTENTPAANAGLKRGDSIVAIDRTDFVSGAPEPLQLGLFPTVTGESHVFTVQSAGASTTRDITLTAAAVTPLPVQNVKSFVTKSGSKLGYMLFTGFNETSEFYLASAVSFLAAQNVSELILDMRYNSGGLLDIAAELAFMIAGPTRTAGKTFERRAYSEKNPFNQTASDNNKPFFSTTRGFSVVPGTPLPTLNLGRVYVLTSKDTCSASESVINGLRGVGVEVVLVGDTTCGKPYGFVATDNCGTTHFSIQFVGVNNLGFGDYTDGFPAACRADDDLTKPLGDPAEGHFLTAATLLLTGVCAPFSAASTNLTSKRNVAENNNSSQAIREPAYELMSGKIVIPTLR
jgi:carboxyl-terminal processing protease